MKEKTEKNGETKRQSERVQTQWNTPKPDPEAEHQKAAVKHPAINTP